MRKRATIERTDLRTFLVDAPPLMADIALGISSHDEAAVADATERLSSEASAVGATRLAQLADVLTEAAHLHQLDRVPPDFGLARAMADAAVACRSELRASEGADEDAN
jgi:hypothetical protein